MTPGRQMTCVLLIIISLTLPSVARAESRIDLAGQWLVRIDRDDNYDPTTATKDERNLQGFRPVQLPGALRDSGLGDPVGPSTGWIANDRPELLQRP